MEDLGIGKKITTYQKRDAIHIAIFPGIAGEELVAGEHVGLSSDDGKTFNKKAKPVGIVDPFLRGRVKVGEQFWVFLYPNTVTSLKHNWSHPDFENDIPEENIFSQLKNFESRKWLEQFATDIGLSYEELMTAAADSVKSEDEWGTYVTIHVDTPYDKLEEFWKHYAKVAYIKLPEKYGKNFFSCSC